MPKIKDIAIGKFSQAPRVVLQCQKCGAFSGDDWSQCNRACPMFGSPHFDRTQFDAYPRDNPGGGKYVPNTVA